jgi:hypothetical protein
VYLISNKIKKGRNFHMKIRMGYPVSTKTGERVSFKTSASAVFDNDGIPVSDRLNKIDLYKYAKKDGYTGSNEEFIDDLNNAIILDRAEDSNIELPDSEVNDNITSGSLTWSSKKITDKVNTVDARLSNLLNSGELTDGDATELHDIRVDNNGMIHPSAGDAVRGQINELTELLDNVSCKSTIVLQDSDYTADAYINFSSGEMGVKGDDVDKLFSASRYVNIGEANYIVLKLKAADNGVNQGDYRGIAFYDVNKLFINGTGIQYAIGQEVYKIERPNNAKYIRFTKNFLSDTSIENTPTLYLYNTIESTSMKEYVHKEIDPSLNKVVINIATNNLITNTYVYHGDGTTVEYIYDGVCATDYIDIETNHKYIRIPQLAGTGGGGTDYRGLAFYDADHVYISGYQYESVIPEYLSIPNNAKYVRFSTFIFKDHSVELFSKIPTVVQELGDSEDDVVSQKTITEEINNINNRINEVSNQDVILTDANGVKYKLIVGTDGSLSTERIG